MARITFVLRSLELVKSLKDDDTLNSMLNNLGNAYSSLGSFDEAVGYYQQALEISQRRRDRRGKDIAISNLGNTFLKLEEFTASILILKKQKKQLIFLAKHWASHGK